jgi:uncharacterized protein
MSARAGNNPESTHDTNDTNDAFERGVELFNRGDFFACHEVWEGLWICSAGTEKFFYQGLIQAAVAILHAERGNLRGAASTWRKARVKLETLPAFHMGIALGEFREALGKFFAHVIERGANAELPVRPRIQTERGSC